MQSKKRGCGGLFNVLPFTSGLAGQDLGKFVTVGKNQQLQAVGYAQFVIDRRQVVPHGGLANAQLARNLLVLQTPSNKQDDLALTLAEQPDAIRLRVCRRRILPVKRTGD